VSFLGLLLQAGARHRWRSWLALTLLVTLVVGLVLASASTARRTATAFPRFVAAHGYDAAFYSVKPLRNVASLPQVSSSVLVRLVASGAPSCPCTRPINVNNFSIEEVPSRQLAQIVKLVGGRMPDQGDPYEVLAPDDFASYGVHVGTVMRVHLAAASQGAAVLSSASVSPRGPVVALHVVGLEVSEFEFPSTTAQPAVDL
jgi:hypothetical protein